MSRDLNQLLRPKSWDTVVGQRDVISVIRQAIHNDRFPRFSIFTGPVGVGKSCIAELVAKALVCEGQERPCGKCHACTSENFRAVQKYNMAALLGKKEILEVLDNIFKFESFAAHSVYILEEVQVLDRKKEQTPFLEELTKIPDDVYVIMCTTQASSLLPALRSRAVEFLLTNPTTEECVGFIQRSLATLHYAPMSDSASLALANLSHNTPRDILKNIELLVKDSSVDESAMQKFFDLVSKVEYITLFTYLVQPTVTLYEYTKYAQKLAEAHNPSTLMFGFRDFMLTILYEVSGGISDGSLSRTDKKHLKDVLSTVNESDFIRALNILAKIRSDEIDSPRGVVLELVKLKLQLLDKTPRTLAKERKSSSAAASVLSNRNASEINGQQNSKKTLVSLASDTDISGVTGLYDDTLYEE